MISEQPAVPPTPKATPPASDPDAGAAVTLLPGQAAYPRIPNYEVLEEIGRGGMAHYGFLCTRCSARRRVAQGDVYFRRGLRVAIVGDLRPTTSPPTPVPIVKQEPLPPTFKNGIGMEFVSVPKGKSWRAGARTSWATRRWSSCRWFGRTSTTGAVSPEKGPC